MVTIPTHYSAVYALLIHYLLHNLLLFLFYYFIEWGQKIVFCNSNNFAPKFGCLITVNTLFKLYVMYMCNIIYVKCVNTLHYITSVKEIKFCILLQFWILHIECIRVCPYSADLVVKILLHTSHLYASSSGSERRCTCVCLLRAEQVVKILLHTEHLKGFSPVWVRICTFSDTFLANSLLQKSQIYGFATLCVALWRTNHPIFKNSLVHSSHLYAFSSMWMKL